MARRCLQPAWGTFCLPCPLLPAPDRPALAAPPRRLLWLAIQRPTWSPAEHRRFPPAFQAAARALLLAAHRGAGMRSGGGAAGASSRRRHMGPARPSGAQLLGTQPEEVVLYTLALAAYPLEEWAWPMRKLS